MVNKGGNKNLDKNPNQTTEDNEKIASCRRKDAGAFVSDNKSKKILSSVNEQANGINSIKIHHASDSECTPKHRRSRTKSFDAADTIVSPRISRDR